MTVVAAVAAAIAAGCGGGGPSAADLTVFAAASLRAPFTELARTYEADSGRRVVLSFGGSGTLAAQIEEGGPADVFASASTTYTDELASRSLIDVPAAFATNTLVVAVPIDSTLTRLADLETPGRKILIGDEGVPVGDLARKVLTALGPDVDAAVQANVVSREQNVADIVSKLLAGDADAGFVYRSDLVGHVADLKEVPLDAAVPVTTTYAIAPVAAGDADGARAFIDLVRSAAGQKVLADAGFGPPP